MFMERPVTDLDNQCGSRGFRDRFDPDRHTRIWDWGRRDYFPSQEFVDELLDQLSCFHAVWGYAARLNFLMPI
jgi:hypothetical protein